MTRIHETFADALGQSRLARAFARNAGVVCGAAGITGAVLQTMNRSVMHGAATVDRMTVSGAFLLASSLACLPADRWPVLKRVSGALALPYAGLMIADAWGKAGFAAAMGGIALPTITCLSMVFERNAKKTDDNVPAKGIVAAFRKAPVLYSAAASALTKVLMMSYAVMNRETLFVPAVALLALENISVGMMDNSVRRFFGVGQPQAAGPKP